MHTSVSFFFSRICRGSTTPANRTARLLKSATAWSVLTSKGSLKSSLVEKRAGGRNPQTSSTHIKVQHGGVGLPNVGSIRSTTYVTHFFKVKGCRRRRIAVWVLTSTTGKSVGLCNGTLVGIKLGCLGCQLMTVPIVDTSGRHVDFDVWKCYDVGWISANVTSTKSPLSQKGNQEEN